jgi:hypothetical protein
MGPLEETLVKARGGDIGEGGDGEAGLGLPQDANVLVDAGKNVGEDVDQCDVCGREPTDQNSLLKCIGLDCLRNAHGVRLFTFSLCVRVCG